MIEVVGHAGTGGRGLSTVGGAWIHVDLQVRTLVNPSPEKVLLYLSLASHDLLDDHYCLLPWQPKLF